MMAWFQSRRAAVALSVLALLSFLGRGFMDWRYEYPLQDPSGNWSTIGALVYLALAGGWIWAILAADKNRRRGWRAALIFAVLLNVLMALATYFIFCPPWTGCQGWPNAWPWNWSNLITGLLAAVAAAYQVKAAQTG